MPHLVSLGLKPGRGLKRVGRDLNPGGISVSLGLKPGRGLKPRSSYAAPILPHVSLGLKPGRGLKQPMPDGCRSVHRSRSG
ncbi:hypothetical protein THIX_60891 [Thiomonas sp. X19]|nr:hypothetical protein THIX_60891 [Thiomonas sp. X19]